MALFVTTEEEDLPVRGYIDLCGFKVSYTGGEAVL